MRFFSRFITFTARMPQTSQVVWLPAGRSRRHVNVWQRPWKCILPRCAKTETRFPSLRISNCWKRSKHIPAPFTAARRVLLSGRHRRFTRYCDLTTLGTPPYGAHRLASRGGILGAKDGIVSTASLILGVAAAHSTHSNILVAGTAGMVAGAMSMGGR